MESEVKTEKIPDDRSVIVVSDLHFGGGEDTETVTRFCHFLDCLRSGNLKITKAGADAGTCPEKMLPPAKIILLGDILELWDPRGQDRNCALLDALVPFLKLRELRCNVIYVTGNHEEDMGEPVMTVDSAAGKRSSLWQQAFRIFTGKENSRRVVESLKIAWNGDYRIHLDGDNKKKPNPEDILEISPRHYPAATTEGNVRGLDVGGIHYAFFHGQQFDREQIMYTISKAVGQRIDIIDNFQDLACCSMIRNTSRSILALGSIISVVVIIIQILSIPVMVQAGMIAALTIALLFLYGIWLFGFSEKKRSNDLPATSTTLLKTCGILLTAELIVVLLGLYFYSLQVFTGFFCLALVLSLSWVFIITIPVFFATIKKPLYGLMNTRLPTDEVYRTAMLDYRYTYNAPVLVFGHTHVPDSFPKNKMDIRKTDPSSCNKPVLMINTGTWVTESTGIVVDSFVYIDSTGVGSMRWKEVDKIVTCELHFTVDEIRDAEARSK